MSAPLASASFYARRRRRIAQDLSAFASLIATPANLGAVAADADSGTAVTLPANARLAISLDDVTVAFDAYSDTFVAADVGDSFTVSPAHGFVTGDGPFEFVAGGGVLPTGVSEGTLYWLIVTSTTAFQVAASQADALAETEVTISNAGTPHATRVVKRVEGDLSIKDGVDQVYGGGGVADFVQKLDQTPKGRDVVVHRSLACPSGTCSLYVLDAWSRQLLIATATFT
jgi:hypothetical protein